MNEQIRDQDSHTFIHPRTGETNTVKVTDSMLRDMMFGDDCICSGPCECTVEPDGTCPNGWQSILMQLGM
jgi:hypothetical protein